MKKLIWIIVLIIAIAGAYSAWNVFGPSVHSPEGKYLYIRTGSTFSDVQASLKKDHILNNLFFFNFISKRAGYTNVKPGRYEIKPGMSTLGLVRMLKSGNQSYVKLVINKLRTRQDLAGKIGRLFECDSLEVMRLLNNNDSLERFGKDTNTAMTAVIPNTYSLSWNGSFSRIYKRLNSEADKFWNEDRVRKASAAGLSKDQVYIMASIVEEETNLPADKSLIASVYKNRIRKGVKLEADPTVKFAMQDFGLKRILRGHLQYPSPYNTYRQTGLPPGPICTPSPATIDSVLNAPETDYMFFVAKPDFRGGSNFAATYPEHQVFAHMYQKALDSLILSKQNR